MPKTNPKYSVKTDNRNLLLMKTPRSRNTYTPLEGEYEINKRGELQYRLRKPNPKLLNGSRKRIIRLSGTYSLDKNNNLLVRLRHRADGRVGEVIKIRGKWIASRAHEFVFLYQLKRRDGGFVSRTLRFEGIWKADRNNRLSFRVIAYRGRYIGDLTLQGAWEIGKKQRIVYRYKKRILGSRRKDLHKIVFAGDWGISSSLSLHYTIEGSSDSRFSFDARLTQKVIWADKGSIKFIVGIRLRGQIRPRMRQITLYGRWVALSRYELGFEWRQSEDGRQNVVFRGRYRLGRGGNISFSFKKSFPGPANIAIRFSRQFLQRRAKLFIEGRLGTRPEYTLLGGATIPW